MGLQEGESLPGGDEILWVDHGAGDQNERNKEESQSGKDMAGVWSCLEQLRVVEAHRTCGFVKYCCPANSGRSLVSHADCPPSNTYLLSNIVS